RRRPGPPLGLLVAGDLAGPHVVDARAVLDAGVRVGQQVVVPDRVLGRPAHRRHHGVGTVVLDPHERRLAQLARPAALAGEDDAGLAFERPALGATAGLVLAHLFGDGL